MFLLKTEINTLRLFCIFISRKIQKDCVFEKFNNIEFQVLNQITVTEHSVCYIYVACFYTSYNINCLINNLMIT